MFRYGQLVLLRSSETPRRHAGCERGRCAVFYRSERRRRRWIRWSAPGRVSGSVNGVVGAELAAVSRCVSRLPWHSAARTSRSCFLPLTWVPAFFLFLETAAVHNSLMPSVLLKARYKKLDVKKRHSIFKWKKALRETQTLRAGCSKAEPKIFAPPQTHFPGARDGKNLISWKWSLPLPINPVW